MSFIYLLIQQAFPIRRFAGRSLVLEMGNELILHDACLQRGEGTQGREADPETETKTLNEWGSA